MQDTYDWAAEKLSSASKETSDGVSKMNKEADHHAGKAHTEAKSYLESAGDTIKVCMVLNSPSSHQAIKGVVTWFRLSGYCICCTSKVSCCSIMLVAWPACCDTTRMIEVGKRSSAHGTRTGLPCCDSAVCGLPSMLQQFIHIQSET